ncbi:MAG: YihY family inner membrane protein [Betaproteobacteria bacterium]
MRAFLRHLGSGVRDLELSRTSAALSFTTLVALVPLATVAVATVAHFPIFEVWLGALEKFLLRHMLPGSASAIVHTYVVGYADRAAQLRGVSLIVIALTAILLFAMVEREINVIFGVTRLRPLVRRVPIYVLGLTVGPVLVGASIWLSTWIMAQSRAIIPRETTLGQWIVAPLPIVLTAIALALTYKLVPNRPVRWAPAIIGGTLASIAFEVMKHGFAWYLTRVPTYEFIYGALAALPVFLIWLHLCWTIVLVGALLAAALDA